MEKFVLYADDDADDRVWIEETFRIIQAELTVSFFENGLQVLDFLKTLSPYEMPSLIILDLNMPGLDGRQTLQRLKADPLYEQVPVAIVSTSSNPLDQELCLRLGANLFLVKPNSFAAWEGIINQLLPLAV